MTDGRELFEELARLNTLAKTALATTNG